MDLRIISLGALGAHPLWNERTPVRSPHATTTLITTGGDGAPTHILVDPSLPAQILLPRLKERANLEPSAISYVFLTSFRPDLRRGIEAFDGAEWLISEAERESVGIPLANSLREAAEHDDDELRAALERDVAILQRCKPAPDRPVPHVSLFPLPGVTPGLTGLLLEEPRHTTLICGDAIPTMEHLEQGKVLQNAVSIEQARASFAEAVEIADLLVLGRDNIALNPTRRPF